MTHEELHQHTLEGTHDAIIFADREGIIQLWTESTNCQRKFASLWGLRLSYAFPRQQSADMPRVLDPLPNIW